jgi:pseudoazurin
MVWLAAVMSAGGLDAAAEDLIVDAQVTSFVPMIVFAKPGDTITWTNMIGHDTVSIDGMIPPGAKPWQSKLGEQYSTTVGAEGAYVYKCTPHIATGMVGAIVVGNGDPGNLAAIDAALEHVPVGKNMVARVIRKMKQALEERGGS